MDVNDFCGIHGAKNPGNDGPLTPQAGIAHASQPRIYPSTEYRSHARGADSCPRLHAGVFGAGCLPNTGISGKGVGQYRLEEGNFTRETRDKAGNPIRDTWNQAGHHIREKWDKAGNYIRETRDKAGNPIRDTRNQAGYYIREKWDKAGNYIRDSWDKAGNATRDTFTKAGHHIRGVRAKDGDHIFYVNDGIAPRGFTGSRGNNASRGVVDEARSGERDNHRSVTSPQAPAREPILEGFNAADRRRLRSAYQNTKSMVDAALKQLLTRGPDSHFVRWFGMPIPENVDHVKQVLSNMQHTLAHEQYTFRAIPPSGLKGAQVWPDGPRLIEMTPLAFGNSYGPKTLEITIAHELSHVRSIGSTRDLTYFPANDRRLAQTNNRAAVTNADNYGMFIGGM